MILFVKKENNTLNVSRGSQESFSRLSNGEHKVEIKKIRNPSFHRKFYGLMSLLKNNQSHFKTMEQLLNFFKRNTGYYETFLDHKGNEYIEYKSISFSKMDDLEFSKFYDACVVLAMEIVGCEESELRNEVVNFI